MDNCCNNYLGDFPHNESVNTGVNTTEGGEHIAMLFFAGVRIQRKFTLSIGELIKIPRPFNELYLYKLEIKKPSGALVSLNSCTNFSFKTYIALNEDCGDVCLEEETIIYQ